MQAAIKVTTRVLPGHRIEVVAPELPEGKDVEVFVALPISPANETPSSVALQTESILDYIDGLPPGPRLFATPEEANRYLKEERDAWDR